MAAFFKSLKKSPRFGIGISDPRGVFCVFAMVHPLDSSKLKIIRAQEHLDSFRTEVGMFLNEHPHRVVTEHQGGPNWNVSATIRDRPPLRLSTIAGDCLVNVRAALDYLMWQFSLRYFQPQPSLDNWEDRTITSFPIFEHAGSKDSGCSQRFERLRKRTHGSPDSKLAAIAISLIEAAQPYHAGQLPLWWLHQLANADKHRLPLLAIAEVSSVQFVTVDAGDGIPCLIDTGGGSTGVAVSDATIGRPDVKVDCQPTILVAFDDVSMPRIPADLLLQQVIECAANTIKRLEGVF
ncbi:MAG: hypothetical protein AB7N65_21430 [Vicinamibacterales bacterium]